MLTEPEIGSSFSTSITRTPHTKSPTQRRVTTWWCLRDILAISTVLIHVSFHWMTKRAHMVHAYCYEFSVRKEREEKGRKFSANHNIEFGWKDGRMKETELVLFQSLINPNHRKQMCYWRSVVSHVSKTTRKIFLRHGIWKRRGAIQNKKSEDQKRST